MHIFPSTNFNQDLPDEKHGPTVHLGHPQILTNRTGSICLSQFQESKKKL